MKLQLLRSLMASEGLDALYLARSSNFAWLTAGRSNVINTATDLGVASVLLAPEGNLVLTNNIEEPRQRAEEDLGGLFEYRITPWHEGDRTIAELAERCAAGADVPVPGCRDLSGAVASLRYTLTPEEIERFRLLGGIAGETLEEAARKVAPGMTEHEIAAAIGRRVLAAGVQPIVILVGTDERIFRYRHPAVTDKRLERYAMLILCARKWGLVAAATRSVHFGPIPEEVLRKQEACTQVDACLISRTRPGVPVAEIFRRGVERYAELGYPDEWKLHHQGGAIGYEPREYLATPDCPEAVREHQAFAYNPSITGTKSEDTILTGPEGIEIITATGNWPTIEAVGDDGRTYPRPAILEKQ